MPIQIKREGNRKEREVTFRVEESGIVSRLYGNLNHDSEEIDKLVGMEKWDL